MRRALRHGFTLIECLLALALTIVLLAAAAAFYSGVVRTREAGSKLAVEAIQARALLDRFADELRHVVALVPGDGQGFKGTKESITIVRTRLPENYAFDEHAEHDTLPPGQMDLVRVTYYLYWDEEERTDETGIKICYGVWRTEQKTFDPNPKFAVSAEEGSEQEGEELDVPRPEGELYAPEIKYLRFEYYDGVKWRDRWNVAANEAGGSAGGGEESGGEAGVGGIGGDKTCVLPQAVKITIGRVREEPEDEELNLAEDQKEKERERLEYHPDRFITVVHLPQADQSLLSSRKKGSIDDRDQMGEQTSGGK